MLDQVVGISIHQCSQTVLKFYDLCLPNTKLFLAIHASFTLNTVYIPYLTCGGFAMGIDLENNLVIGPECFICFEACTTQTTCECRMFVHENCLHEYIFASQLTHCTICLAPYMVPQARVLGHRSHARTYQCIAFFVVLNAALWIFQSTTHIFPQVVVVVCTVVSAMVVCTHRYFIRQKV